MPQERQNTDGVFILSLLACNKLLLFAINNTDVKIDTWDEKGQLHGTTNEAFQQQGKKQ